jgi:hypothetical protein
MPLSSARSPLTAAAGTTRPCDPHSQSTVRVSESTVRVSESTVRFS